MAKPSYAERVISDGATHYWRLDEASGLALDSVGGAHGTVSGGVTRGVSGLLAEGGKAARFDGATGKVTSTPLAVSVPFTIETWASLEPGFTRWPALIAFTAGASYWLFNFTTDTTLFGTVTSSAGQTSMSATVPSIVGTRRQIVWVFRGGTTVEAYCDGVAVTLNAQPAATPHAIPAAAFSIGWMQDWGPQDWWKGPIDEVALYGVALTPAQILAHYQLGVGTFDSTRSKGSPAMPVADKVLLQGAVAGDTTSPAVDVAGAASITAYVVTNGGVTSGAVVIEESHDMNYAGTWVVVQAVASLGVTRVVVPGTAKAVRARVTSPIVGGNVSVHLVAAGD